MDTRRMDHVVLILLFVLCSNKILVNAAWNDYFDFSNGFTLDDEPPRLSWNEPTAKNVQYVVSWIPHNKKGETGPVELHTNYMDLSDFRRVQATFFNFTILQNGREVGSIYYGTMPDSHMNFVRVNAPREVLVKSHSIVIAWKEPYLLKNKISKFYMIYWLNKNQIYHHAHRNNQTHAVIKGLDPDTVYQFHISATTNEGSTQFSHSLTVRTRPIPKSVRTMLRVLEESDGWIVVTWHSPVAIPSAVQWYYILVEKDEGNNVKRQMECIGLYRYTCSDCQREVATPEEVGINMTSITSQCKGARKLKDMGSFSATRDRFRVLVPNIPSGLSDLKITLYWVFADDKIVHDNFVWNHTKGGSCHQIECYHLATKGRFYMGHRNKDVARVTCEPWSKHFTDPYASENFPDDYFPLEENYCRNPVPSWNTRDRPWCYVTNVQGQLVQSFCNIAPCTDKEVECALKLTVSKVTQSSFTLTVHLSSPSAVKNLKVTVTNSTGQVKCTVYGTIKQVSTGVSVPDECKFNFKHHPNSPTITLTNLKPASSYLLYVYPTIYDGIFSSYMVSTKDTTWETVADDRADFTSRSVMAVTWTTPHKNSPERYRAHAYLVRVIIGSRCLRAYWMMCNTCTGDKSAVLFHGKHQVKNCTHVIKGKALEFPASQVHFKLNITDLKSTAYHFVAIGSYSTIGMGAVINLEIPSSPRNVIMFQPNDSNIRFRWTPPSSSAFIYHVRWTHDTGTVLIINTTDTSTSLSGALDPCTEFCATLWASSMWATGPSTTPLCLNSNPISPSSNYQMHYEIHPKRSPRAITLIWVRYPSTKCKKIYEISYQTKHNRVQQDVITIQTNKTKYTFINLTHSQGYRFRLRTTLVNPVTNVIRYGSWTNWSRPVYVPDSISGPVSKMTVTMDAASNMVVVWGPPKSPGGRIFGYLIVVLDRFESCVEGVILSCAKCMPMASSLDRYNSRIKQCGNTQMLNFQSGTEMFQATLRHAKPGNKYTINIYAINGYGPSNISTESLTVLKSHKSFFLSTKWIIIAASGAVFLFLVLLVGLLIAIFFFRRRSYMVMIEEQRPIIELTDNGKICTGEITTNGIATDAQ